MHWVNMNETIHNLYGAYHGSAGWEEVNRNIVQWHRDHISWEPETLTRYANTLARWLTKINYEKVLDDRAGLGIG